MATHLARDTEKPQLQRVADRRSCRSINKLICNFLRTVPPFTCFGVRIGLNPYRCYQIQCSKHGGKNNTNFKKLKFTDLIMKQSDMGSVLLRGNIIFKPNVSLVWLHGNRACDVTHKTKLTSTETKCDSVTHENENFDWIQNSAAVL
jgi:hypothetical protein